MKRVIQATAVLSVASLVGTLGAATAWSAQDTTRATVKSHVRLDAGELRALAKERAGSAASERAKQAFLDSQARSGVLWDDAEVTAVATDAAADATTAAWSTNVTVESVETAVVEQADGRVTPEIQAVASPGDPNAASARFRAGADALQNVSGQVSGSYSGGALTVQVSGDKLTSAWERYRVRESKTDRNIFYYGHWATAVGKVVDNDFDHFPGVIDIRSRPTSGHKWKFMNMRNYWPKESGAACNDYNISIGILGFSAGLPLGNCNGFTPDPDASNYLMKNVWSDGACRDSRAEYVDLGMAVDVKPGTGVAMLSDYSYARFEDAPCDQVASNDVRVIYADPGWS